MKIPKITWAQNSKYIYLNILLEPKENILNIKNNIFYFKQEDYEIKFELNNDIEDNFKITKNKNIELDILKKNHIFWNNLLKDSTIYKNNISINWSRWIDEDDDTDIYNLDDIHINSTSSEEDDNNNSTDNILVDDGDSVNIKDNENSQDNINKSIDVENLSDKKN